jgi:hypothetical protein
MFVSVFLMSSSIPILGLFVPVIPIFELGNPLRSELIQQYRPQIGLLSINPIARNKMLCSDMQM